IENYTVLVIQDKTGNVAIEKRPDKGLLANMWQFPMINQAQADSGMIQKLLSEKYNLHIKLGEHMQTIKHVFTHIIWYLNVYHATTEKSLSFPLTFDKVTSLEHYPIYVSHQKIVHYLKDLNEE